MRAPVTAQANQDFFGHFEATLQYPPSRQQQAFTADARTSAELIDHCSEPVRNWDSNHPRAEVGRRRLEGGSRLDAAAQIAAAPKLASDVELLGRQTLVKHVCNVRVLYLRI